MQSLRGQLLVAGPTLLDPNFHRTVVLADFEGSELDSMEIQGPLGLVLPDSDLEEIGSAVRRARAFLGYAGWGPGQLESELERDDWIVAEFAPTDAFTDDPDRLWAEVLGRKGGQYALLATMPPDPSVN